MQHVFEPGVRDARGVLEAGDGQRRRGPLGPEPLRGRHPRRLPGHAAARALRRGRHGQRRLGRVSVLLFIIYQRINQPINTHEWNTRTDDTFLGMPS